MAGALWQGVMLPHLPPAGTGGACCLVPGSLALSDPRENRGRQGWGLRVTELHCGPGVDSEAKNGPYR